MTNTSWDTRRQHRIYGAAMGACFVAVIMSELLLPAEFRSYPNILYYVGLIGSSVYLYYIWLMPRLRIEAAVAYECVKLLCYIPVLCFLIGFLLFRWQLVDEKYSRLYWVPILYTVYEIASAWFLAGRHWAHRVTNGDLRSAGNTIRVHNAPLRNRVFWGTYKDSPLIWKRLSVILAVLIGIGYFWIRDRLPMLSKDVSLILLIVLYTRVMIRNHLRDVISLWRHEKEAKTSYRPTLDRSEWTLKELFSSFRW